MKGNLCYCSFITFCVFSTSIKKIFLLSNEKFSFVFSFHVHFAVLRELISFKSAGNKNSFVPLIRNPIDFYFCLSSPGFFFLGRSIKRSYGKIYRDEKSFLPFFASFNGVKIILYFSLVCSPLKTAA